MTARSRTALATAILLLALALAQPVRDELIPSSPHAPLHPSAGTGALVGSVLLGSFRPLLLTTLWLRGDVLYGERQHEECFELCRLLHELYPGNERARSYLGWFLAFDLKRNAPDVAVGWEWTETGLDMLLPLPDGPSTIADWILKQCGQNASDFRRYAGPSWEEERAWRARLRRFGSRHYGLELTRFELGVRVLEGRGGLADRARRARLLRYLAYEEWLRSGESPHALDAIVALRETAADFSDDPEVGPYFAERARILEAVSSGQQLEALPEPREAYLVAMALLGRGAKARDLPSLKSAQEILERISPEVLAEEIDLVSRWRAYLSAPQGSGTPPPLPCDGTD